MCRLNTFHLVMDLGSVGEAHQHPAHIRFNSLPSELSGQASSSSSSICSSDSVTLSYPPGHGYAFSGTMAHQVHEVPWDLQTNKRLSLLLRYDNVDQKTIPDIMLHLLATFIFCFSWY